MDSKQNAIQWCKQYLPEWPTNALHLKSLARPMGWTWRNTLPSYFELVSGKEHITINDVFPTLTPAPAPIVYPDHVYDFLDSINSANHSEIPNENCEILLNQEIFDKLFDDYYPLRIDANSDKTSSIVDGIKVRVLNDHILAVSTFIELNVAMFSMHCASMGFNHNDVRKTLIHQCE